MVSRAEDDGPMYEDGSDADGFKGGDQRMVTQVGGTHYQSEYQHWDFVEESGMGYLEGCASKYLIRWREKNGLEDLKKARSYAQKLLILFQFYRHNRIVEFKYDQFHRFCNENSVVGPERDALLLLCRWSKDSDLTTVSDIINTIIAKNFPEVFESKVGGDPSWNADITS